MSEPEVMTRTVSPNANDLLLFSVPDPDFTYLGGILNPIPGLVYYLFFLTPLSTGLPPP